MDFSWLNETGFSALAQARPLLAACSVVGSAVVVGWLCRLLLCPLLRAASRNRVRWDEGLLRVLRRHIIWWTMAGGIWLAPQVIQFGSAMRIHFQHVAAALFITSASFAAARTAIVFIRAVAARSAVELPLTSALETLVRLSVWAVGGLLILSNLGISITPLVTALGVGSLALALGLQDTLSNLVAGLYTTMARHLRVGDFVEFDGGHRGFITDIGWRTTRIRTPQNNIILVPNAKLMQTIVTNYDLPVQEQAASVEVRIGLHNDLAAVETLTLEVARDVQQTVTGAIVSFEPTVRFQGFPQGGVVLQVALQAKSFADRALVIHEFLKRVHTRFRQAGVELGTSAAAGAEEVRPAVSGNR
ncbi:MAG: mechanosensitive ion channel family protein [Deltaproteobacteria bacterium]|nr:mechanosensitive ion channel family protein [Deltaproteobacteria bacterium]